jgi:hypothetical protein
MRWHALRTHESFMLAANAMARALAGAGASDGVGDGVRGKLDIIESEEEEKQEEKEEEESTEEDKHDTAVAATNAEALAGLYVPSMPWWEAAARAAVPPANLANPSDKEKRKMKRRATQLREQLEDAWQLLEMAWVHSRGGAWQNLLAMS